MKYLPSSTMVYSCTCARLQNPEAPSLVCVPRPGFAAPVRIPQTAAHTNTAPSEQSPKIVNTVTDYPATVHRHYRYRGACVWGAWARNVSIGRGTRRFRSQKRGEGYVRRVRITDPLPPKVVVHARDTWQHTYRYTEFPVPPATKKPSFRTSRTSRPHAIMQTRGGARKRVHDSGHPPTHESARGTGAISARYHPAASETLTRYQRDVSEMSARYQRDREMATDALLLLGIAVLGRVRGLLLVGVAALAIARAAGKVAAGRPSWVAALHPLQHVPGLLLPLAVSRRLLDDLASRSRRLSSGLSPRVSPRVAPSRGWPDRPFGRAVHHLQQSQMARPFQQSNPLPFGRR